MWYRLLIFFSFSWQEFFRYRTSFCTTFFFSEQINQSEKLTHELLRKSTVFNRGAEEIRVDLNELRVSVFNRGAEEIRVDLNKLRVFVFTTVLAALLVIHQSLVMTDTGRSSFTRGHICHQGPHLSPGAVTHHICHQGP